MRDLTQESPALEVSVAPIDPGARLKAGLSSRKRNLSPLAKSPREFVALPKAAITNSLDQPEFTCASNGLNTTRHSEL